MARRLLASHAASSARYCLRTHTWTRYLPGVQQRGRVQLGLTERGIEDIGDIAAVDALATVGDSVRASQSLLRIEWSAMRISDGDELYHTTWANVEGNHIVGAPCSGTIAATNWRANWRANGLDADEWLVELAVAETVHGSEVLAHLVDEERYLLSCGVGTFGESDEALVYTSYG